MSKQKYVLTTSRVTRLLALLLVLFLVAACTTGQDSVAQIRPAADISTTTERPVAHTPPPDLETSAAATPQAADGFDRAGVDQLPPSEFTPDLTLLDEVITSMRSEPHSAQSSEETAPHSAQWAQAIAPPTGLVYRASDGLWCVGAGGEPQLLTEKYFALPAPGGAYAVYMDDERRLWLIDYATANERPLATDVDLAGHYQWGDEQTLLLGVWLAADESEGAATGHMATLDIETGELNVIDEEYLSLGRPALAPDGQTVAYDISPYYPEAILTGYFYRPDSGSQPMDARFFEALGQERPLHLYNPAWSPDGTQLAWLWVAEKGTSLVRFNLAEQTAMTVHAWQPLQFGALPPSPVWSPDGQWLAIDVWANNGAESGLWLLAADGSIAQRLSERSDSAVVGSGPIWFSSHELAFILCNENYSDCENRLYDLVSETTSTLDLPPGSAVLMAPSAAVPTTKGIQSDDEQIIVEKLPIVSALTMNMDATEERIAYQQNRQLWLDKLDLSGDPVKITECAEPEIWLEDAHNLAAWYAQG